MELEKRKVITLGGKSLTGPVTIEGFVKFKDPADILVADIPSSQVYSVSPVPSIEDLVIIDIDQIQVSFHNEVELCDQPNKDGIIDRFTQLRTWLENHLDNLEIISWYLDPSYHVDISYVVLFDGDTFADVLKQVSDLLDTIEQQFGIQCK